MQLSQAPVAHTDSLELLLFHSFPSTTQASQENTTISHPSLMLHTHCVSTHNLYNQCMTYCLLLPASPIAALICHLLSLISPLAMLFSSLMILIIVSDWINRVPAPVASPSWYAASRLITSLHTTNFPWLLYAMHIVKHPYLCPPVHLLIAWILASKCTF